MASFVAHFQLFNIVLLRKSCLFYHHYRLLINSISPPPLNICIFYLIIYITSISVFGRKKDNDDAVSTNGLHHHHTETIITRHYTRIWMGRRTFGQCLSNLLERERKEDREERCHKNERALVDKVMRSVNEWLRRWQEELTLRWLFPVQQMLRHKMLRWDEKTLI